MIVVFKPVLLIDVPLVWRNICPNCKILNHKFNHYYQCCLYTTVIANQLIENSKFVSSKYHFYLIQYIISGAAFIIALMGCVGWPYYRPTCPVLNDCVLNLILSTAPCGYLQTVYGYHIIHGQHIIQTLFTSSRLKRLSLRKSYLKYAF